MSPNIHEDNLQLQELQLYINKITKFIGEFNLLFARRNTSRATFLLSVPLSFKNNYIKNTTTFTKTLKFYQIQINI